MIVVMIIMIVVMIVVMIIMIVVMIVVMIIVFVHLSPHPPRPWTWGTIPLGGGTGKPGTVLIYLYHIHLDWLAGHPENSHDIVWSSAAEWPHAVIQKTAQPWTGFGADATGIYCDCDIL